MANILLQSTVLLRATAKVFVPLLIFAFAAKLMAQPSTPAPRNFCEILTLEGQVQIFFAQTQKWEKARTGQLLHEHDALQTGERSRATVRFSDFSVARINELTVFGIEPPRSANRKPLFNLKSGSIYFYSREKPAEIEFKTPIASGAIRGTEFYLSSDDTTTTLALLDGQIDIANEAGSVTLKSGEGVVITPGRKPVAVPLIDAMSVIQWCLYYPAIIDPAELAFSDVEAPAFARSLEAYRSGDILLALDNCPTNTAQFSENARIYRAALDLAVGRQKLLRPSTNHLKNAFEEMIAATTGVPWTNSVAPASASEFLAQSYYLQSQFRLQPALASARAAVERSPQFGYAWVRLAELEFSLGHTENARIALEKGIALSPRNAQAHALQGFILSARGQVDQAAAAFSRAIEINGSLGNAWLGRGLCKIRKGDPEGGRRDLQTAAALEPQRALFRSYIGKAFQHTGNTALAEKELRLARKLDPNDPTAWLYLALLNEQNNQFNEAIKDLEESKARNDNQRLFRSRFMLDQDQAARQVTLAQIYREAGMPDVSVREASSSLESDYANYAAHLFLSRSYESLVDPLHYNFRYTAPTYNEWFIGNLLAPAGAQDISLNPATRELSPYFVTDRPRFASGTTYTSQGYWQELASQYGTFGRTDYSVDFRYERDPGQRPNNDFEIAQLSAQTRVRIDEKDTLFLHVEDFHATSGDRAQYYSPLQAQFGERKSENLSPALYAGLHREWQPNSHTLFLGGYHHRTLSADFNPFQPLFFYYVDQRIASVNPGIFPFTNNFYLNNDTYLAEVQHIWQLPSQTLIVGSRFQSRVEQVATRLGTIMAADIRQSVDPTELRSSLYAYDQIHLLDSLHLTLGANYSWIHFARNLDVVPVSAEMENKDRLLPKVGLIYDIDRNTTIRAHYTQSLGASSTDDAIQLEPTIVGGINQMYHNVIPVSVVGVTPASTLSTYALAIDHVFPTRTYTSLEGTILQSDADHWVGALTNSTFFPAADRPSTFKQLLSYEEQSLVGSIDQLVGREWCLSLSDRVTHSHLDASFPEVPISATNASSLFWNKTAVLNQLAGQITFNHSSGAFAQFQTLWTVQWNDNHPSLLNDDFFQHNVFVGYRFPRRFFEVRLGVLNLTDEDYHLNPLNYYIELPRSRTFTATAILNF